MERPMNTAGRDRAVLAIIEQTIRRSDKKHTPVSRIKVGKGEGGAVNVSIYTSRPTAVRIESDEITSAITEQIGDKKKVNVSVVPEARAIAKFVRMSPRKARLVGDAIKGKRVSEAMALLQFIPNHASEPILKVIKSAAANAQDGWGAVPEELKVANIIADGGPTIKRIRARAQGRAYRILKRTSHLTVVLTEAPAPPQRRRPAQAVPARASAAAPAKEQKATGAKKRLPKPAERQEETKARIAAEPVETAPAATEETAAEAPQNTVVMGENTASVESAAEAAAPEAAAEETPVAEAPESGEAPEANEETSISEEPAKEG
jgi:large subunit ribosomal protein L22